MSHSDQLFSTTGFLQVRNVKACLNSWSFMERDDFHCLWEMNRYVVTEDLVHCRVNKEQVDCRLAESGGGVSIVPPALFKQSSRLGLWQCLPTLEPFTPPRLGLPLRHAPVGHTSSIEPSLVSSCVCSNKKNGCYEKPTNRSTFMGMEQSIPIGECAHMHIWIVEFGQFSVRRIQSLHSLDNFVRSELNLTPRIPHGAAVAELSHVVMANPERSAVLGTLHCRNTVNYINDEHTNWTDKSVFQLQ